MVVVPEHRCALIVRIQVERALSRGGEVFGPAIARRVRDRAMKVDDRESGERSRGRIDLAPAASRQALHGNTLRACAWCDRDDDRQGAGEPVVPPHLERNTTPNLDRRTREVAVVRPNPRWREIAVKAVRRALESHRKTSGLGDHAARRKRERIDEWAKRVSKRHADPLRG